MADCAVPCARSFSSTDIEQIIHFLNAALVCFPIRVLFFFALVFDHAEERGQDLSSVVFLKVLKD